MRIENQVCTFEQGVKLFNYGITQSLFNHVHTKDGKEHWIDHNSVFDENNIYIPAFTVAELGVMLSDFTNSHQWNDRFPNYYNDGITGFWEWFLLDLSNQRQGLHQTEAEARAAMLIYLIENKHVNVEGINTKLLNS